MDRIGPSRAPKHLQSLCQQLGNQMSAGIGIACTDVDGDPQALYSVEVDAIRRAIPRRQREFAAGRAAAREAMAHIDWPPTAIPSAPDRSPVWPRGLVGSIAHNRIGCVAIAGRQQQVHALGVDLEEDVPIEAALWETICTPEELNLLSSIPQSEQGRWVTQVFCAKEAFYKWQFSQTSRMLSFCDVHVSFNSNNQEFRAHTERVGPRHPPRNSLEGRGHLISSSGLLLAWLSGAPLPSMS